VKFLYEKYQICQLRGVLLQLFQYALGTEFFCVEDQYREVWFFLHYAGVFEIEKHQSSSRLSGVNTVTLRFLRVLRENAFLPSIFLVLHREEVQLREQE
jgi:hypothetical protein